MANSVTLNQQMRKEDAPCSLNSETYYAAVACSGQRQALKLRGEASDCDSAFLADRGYFSGASF